ncbi:uncharacterized protein LOC142171892 [Nicotiana tabacum]|uniref:Uncharacterized protein LOC142171892 n=1 Tax=Nicotiana tabacum TaxID=4097 RepID=A0AC58T3C9_TOBAC
MEEQLQAIRQELVTISEHQTRKLTSKKRQKFKSKVTLQGLRESDMLEHNGGDMAFPVLSLECRKSPPKDDHVVNIVEDTEQQVTCHISQHMSSTPLYLTVVYAKCKAHLRLQLWEELRGIASRIQGAWGVVGDFNVITDCTEKKGGNPYRLEKSVDFLSYIDNCGLQDAGFYGSMYTWSDNRGPPNTIWKRLDRSMFNTEWSDEFSETSVEHLARKLKRVTKRLSSWSREAFGDIYEEPKRLEKKIKDLEELYIADTTSTHRSKLNEAKTKYMQVLKIQDEVLRQKAKAQWIEEGDKNTAYFHSVIKGRRRRLSIQKIQDENGPWKEGESEIAQAAINHFQEMFNHGAGSNDFSALECINLRVTDEENDMLTALPILEEIIESVYSIDPTSALGPDGLNAIFFQKYWTIIADDVHNAVLAFFEGATIPRFFSHTCLVMKPKVEFPQKLSELKPISLCNVLSKITSKWKEENNQASDEYLGGLSRCIRSLQDICKALSSKIWWNLRTGNSLWRDFMLSKYGSRYHPVAKKPSTGTSDSWKQMCKIKHKVEEHMIWLVGNGEVSFWYDNWTSLGPLCKYLGDEARPKDIKLRDVFVNGEWNENNTGLTWLESLKNIVQNMDLVLCPDKPDKPIWVPDSRGTFTTSSTWNIFR